MGRVYGLSAWEMFTKIILSGAASSIMIGVRQSLGGTWLILIVAETVAAQSGIGYMATNAREFMMMDVVVLSMVIYALLRVISGLTAKTQGACLIDGKAVTAIDSAGRRSCSSTNRSRPSMP